MNELNARMKNIPTTGTRYLYNKKIEFGSFD